MALRKHAHMQYTEMFLVVKSLKFPGEVVLTRTHNLCFGAKLRKKVMPQHNQVLQYKSGVQGGIHCTDMYSWCVNFFSVKDFSGTA